MLRCAILLLCLLVPLHGGAAVPGGFDFRSTPGRLSKDVRPTHCTLRLQLDPERDDFAGHVAIDVEVAVPAASIELHASELEAGEARLVQRGRVRPLRVVAQPETQTWRLVPTDGARVDPGAQRIEIAYRGRVRGNGEGLFRAEYRDGERRRPMLATQLQAIYARTVFPAFDEPAFRLRFTLEVQAPDGLEVVSNMPRTTRRAGPHGVLHRFATTPPMPSYLVAVAAGRFDVLSGRAAGVPLRILTAPGKRDQARYALQVTRRVLPWYTQYFGQPYALPRLDQFAVPGTRQGAMEDWGLISYAENLLLFDPSRSSPETERRVFGFAAHEIAHQWFGNLVTAAWWDEIWLNESFATWLATKAAERFNPAWQVPLHERGRIEWAMERDASVQTRAIRNGPVTEDRVFDGFDRGITYTKGGAVLAMLEGWIGEAAFQRGLAAYMADRRLSNATAVDLWTHIGRAAGRDVAAVAASWTDQPGFPLVQVEQRCDAGDTWVRLRQRRFALDPQAPAADTLWRIPVRLARGGRAETVLLSEREQTHRLRGCGAEPLVVNAGGRGYYRVELAPDHFAALQRRFAALAPADRVTLLADTFALAHAGRTEMSRFFDLLAQLPRLPARDAAVLWVQACKSLRLLDRAFAGLPAQAALHAAARALLAPKLAALGWTPRPGDDSETLVLRGTLVETLARFDDTAVRDEARRRFDADARGSERLPASIRAGVIRAVGLGADRATFDALLAQLRDADGEEARWLFAQALASGGDAARAAELLELSRQEAALPVNIASELPGLVAELSPFGALAYRHTLAHWSALAARAGVGGRTHLLPDAAAGFSDRADAERLAADQRRLLGPEGENAAARQVTRITLLAMLRERDAATLAALLPGWRPAS